MKDLFVTDLHGRELPLYIFDFETYWDTKIGYSLAAKGMTTTKYVRDPRFRAHGCVVVYPNRERAWISHNDLPDFFSRFDWENVAVGAHNAPFDMLVLSEIYGCRPAYLVDTMCMSTGEWGAGERHSLKLLLERLDKAPKVAGELEKTDGVYELSYEQERQLATTMLTLPDGTKDLPYAMRDGVGTLEAFEEMYFDRGFPEKEMHIIDITLKAFCHPKLEIHAPLLEAEIEAERLRLKKLFEGDLLAGIELSDNCAGILEEKGMQGLLRSRDCFADMLRARGIAPPMKPATGEKGKRGELTYAFGKKDFEFQALEQDPRVGDLVSAKMGSTTSIRKARAEIMLLHSDNGAKPIPVGLRYCGARTHRWSAFDVAQFQNLPSGRDGLGQRHRQSIRAPKGKRIVVVDSSAVECRVNAYLWDEESLLKIFREGGDPYCDLAGALYNIEVGKHGPNADKRPMGKAMELGLGFGMGVRKFFYSALTGASGVAIPDITWEEAEKGVQIYRIKRPKIQEGWNTATKFLQGMVAQRNGGQPFSYKGMTFYHNRVTMPNGLHMWYRQLNYMKDEESGKWGLAYWHKNGWTRIWGSKFVENLVQSYARSIVAQQALMIAKRYPDIALLVHDEVVYLVDEDEADEALDFGIECLRTALEWCPGIPLDAEGAHDIYYVDK